MSSVTLVHPAKAVGQNEMPFGRDTGVVPSNTVLDRSPGLQTGKGDLVVGIGSSQLCRLSLKYFGRCSVYECPVVRSVWQANDNSGFSSVRKTKLTTFSNM